MYQVWFTSNVLPAFTDENKSIYREFVENQSFPIGNIVNGRHLLRCLTDDFAPIKEYLDSIGKAPIVCGARYEDGSWLEEYPKNQELFDQHMQPVEIVASNGETMTLEPADNTTMGWLAFNDPEPAVEG